MKLRYLIVDSRGRLRKVSRAAVTALWKGELDAQALGCDSQTELRLVSAVCDRHLLPRKLYVLRLPLSDGRFTEESYLTLRIYSRPEYVTQGELVGHHTAGWPADFYRQLAVALDVPVAQTQVPLAVGGPLFLAAALRVSPRQAVRYLR
jgi:hypothetical protein